MFKETSKIQYSVSHRERDNGCLISWFRLLARKKGKFVDWRDNGFIRGWRVVATERRWLSLKRFWSTRFPVAIVAQRAIVNRDFRILSLSPSLSVSLSLHHLSLPFSSPCFSSILIVIKLIDSIQSWIFYQQ